MKRLAASSITRLLVMDLDGFSCEATGWLRPALSYECATQDDVSLPSETVAIRRMGARAVGLQGWSQSISSGYGRFLLWKIRLIERVLMLGSDVAMLDVDVLALRPSFLSAIVSYKSDFVIASDARTNNDIDDEKCPGSRPEHQQFTRQWVCAGMIYARANASAVSWLLQETSSLMQVRKEAQPLTPQTPLTMLALPLVPLRTLV
jgi:hypothetical protein